VKPSHWKPVEPSPPRAVVPSQQKNSIRVHLSRRVNFSLFRGKLPYRSASGSDEISNTMQRNLSPLGRRCLLHTANLSWLSGEVPATRRIAEIRPIAKPGKPPIATSSFRPISLLSCIGKLVKRLIHERLAHFLESSHLLHPLKRGSVGTDPQKSRSRQSPSSSTTVSNREGYLYLQLSSLQTSPELMTESGEKPSWRKWQEKEFQRALSGWFQAFCVTGRHSSPGKEPPAASVPSLKDFHKALSLHLSIGLYTWMTFWTATLSFFSFLPLLTTPPCRPGLFAS